MIVARSYEPERTMKLTTLKRITPWWVKMAGHIMLSNLPGGYALWHRLGVLQHGRMEDPSYAYPVFMKHFERVRKGLPHRAFTALELGPGDSISSAVIARSLGASHYYLVDDGNFARHDVGPYQSLATYLAAKGLRPPSLNEARTRTDVLAACHAEYGPHGLTSLQRFQPGPSTLYGRTGSCPTSGGVTFSTICVNCGGS